MKRIFTWLFFVVFSISVFAEPVDSTEISNVANSFVQMVYTGDEALEIVSIRPLQLNREETLVALVVFSPQGWMLVSMDDVAQPVLGYAFDRPFDEVKFKTNTSFKFLLDGYDSRVKELKKQTVKKDPEWDRIKKKERLKASVVPVAPLIPVEWNQDRGWNSKCPADEDGPGGHVYVGCVAIAMGQAMTVSRFPVAGVGKKTYSHPDYGIQSVNFDTFGNYAWSNMITNTPNTDIANFLYHLAVTVEMDFGADGSGAFTNMASSALKKYFSYSSTVTYVDRVASDDEWIALLNTELTNGRPVIYGGDADDGASGHAFDIDGVSTWGFYHLNWGWSGSNNGYFYINTLSPGSYDFTANQSAIIGIKPIATGPTAISLSKTTVLANLPVGSVVGNIVVQDENPNNSYTYVLKGREDIFGNFADPNFYEENGVLKTSKVFSYTEGGTNKDFVTIIVTDAYNNSLSKEFTIGITKNTATAIDENKLNKAVFYDNTTRSLRFLEAIVGEEQRLDIYSISGQLIRSESVFGTTVDVSDLPTGVYVVTYGAVGSKKYLKFIKN